MISQEELGKKVFVNNQHISRIEAGSVKPSLELLILIANALGISADDLLAENLTHTAFVEKNEVIHLLKNCSPREEEFLTRALAALKDLFEELMI